MANEFRKCYKCGYETNEVTRNCPTCGRRMLSSRHVRVLGGLQLFLGLFLVGFMGAITVYLAPMMLQPETGGSGAHFTGTPAQAQIILLLFALVIIFGLASMISGGWQIITGRRNKWILILSFAVLFLLVMVGSAVRSMLA